MPINPLDILERLPAVTLLLVDKPDSESVWADHFAQRLKAQVAGQLIRLHVAPEKSTIKLEQIREILELCAAAPPQGVGQWVWIQQADALTPEAANAMLKLLEEPWPRIWFLLSSSRGDAVLPTIRSRAVLIRSPHQVQTPDAVPAIEELAGLGDLERMALAERLSEDDAASKVFLQQWLGHLRWQLHTGQGQEADLVNQSDALLAALSHWGRPIQKRLALEALLMG